MDFRSRSRSAGPKTAPRCSCCQGQSNSHEWWAELREDFSPQFRTITFDYRGTGGSRGELGELSTASFAADAAEVLDRLGVDCAPPPTARRWAGGSHRCWPWTSPNGSARLCSGARLPGGPHSVKRPRKVGQSLARLRGQEHTRYLFDLFYTPAWTVPSEYSKLLGDDTMTPAESAAHLRISAGHNAWDRLPEISAPTLIVHGDDDRMNPVDNAHILHERIAGSQMLILPEGRHGFFEEFAEVVTPAVVRFLSESLPRLLTSPPARRKSKLRFTIKKSHSPANPFRSQLPASTADYNNQVTSTLRFPRSEH